MAANTAPIFSLVPNVDWVIGISTAHNDPDLTTGTSYLVFTAGAEGSYLKEIHIKAKPGDNTAATVLRIWINNGSTLSTAANSVLYAEYSLPATTASAAAAMFEMVIAMELALDPSFRVYLTIGTATGGSGALHATAVGGNY